MDHMPVVVVFELVTRRHARVGPDDCVQTVQLMRHASSEDGGVGPDDGGWEVVEGFGVGDFLETHADGHQVIPGLQGLGLEKVGCVVWRESLVDFEGGDLCGYMRRPASDVSSDFMCA